jgi:Na+/H+-dicarboxylate symporter
MLRAWFGIALWKRVLGGLILGVIFALLWPAATGYVAFLGDLFVRLIRMLVVPVVLITIASGVTSLGDPKKLGAVGLRTLGLFAFTTFLAVSLGMAVGLLVQPGEGAQIAGASAHALGEPKSTYDQLIGIVPLNLFTALAEGDMLALIFFSILLGISVLLAGEAGAPIAGLLQSASSVLFQMIRLVMEVTPFGVFALSAGAVAANGVAVFTNIGWLALCVFVCALLQMGVIHSLMLRLLARMSPRFFFRAIIDALVVAFSTASSSATLPVALRVARDNLKLDRAVASTVLPIGASIGKDGTAMYVGLLSIFALQALGITPDAGMLAIMLLTGALAAFGTAPIPSASLFMLAAVLAAVGVDASQTALIVGFILPFDRLLDMTRTVPSASANLTVASIVARGVAPDGEHT